MTGSFYRLQSSSVFGSESVSSSQSVSTRGPLLLLGQRNQSSTSNEASTSSSSQDATQATKKPEKNKVIRVNPAVKDKKKRLVHFIVFCVYFIDFSKWTLRIIFLNKYFDTQTFFSFN
jgi:hypothetical protein